MMFDFIHIANPYFVPFKSSPKCVCVYLGESVSPSSSLRSAANSADSEREASEVRLEDPEEAWLGGRLPIRRLIQCSHREELVDPKVPNRQQFNM